MDADCEVHAVRLAQYESVEVILPDGSSVWVAWDGATHKQKKERKGK